MLAPGGVPGFWAILYSYELLGTFLKLELVGTFLKLELVGTFLKLELVGTFLKLELVGTFARIGGNFCSNQWELFLYEQIV